MKSNIDHITALLEVYITSLLDFKDLLEIHDIDYYPSLIITLPDAELIVRLFPVVFITGFGIALGSKVIAFKVPLTDNNLVGAVVPMPTLPD